MTKSYGGPLVNDSIDLSVRSGEVHALVGENGAGKSTLVSILSGRLQPDGGSIAIEGVVVSLLNPRSQADRGVSTVFQELMLVPTMTGFENIALALGVSPNRATRKLVTGVQAKFSLPANLDAPVRALELPQRQRVELIRALCQRPKILLLDEPTSLLSPTEVPALLAKVRDLADGGLAVLFITHRLDEVRTVADRISVLRRGRLVRTYEHAALPPNAELAAEMLGAAVPMEAEAHPASDEVCLRVDGVVVRGDHGEARVRGASLELRAGEILGIAGVDGNGQLELVESIAGLREREAGEIAYFGVDLGNADYERLHRDGVQFVSGDRARYGIVPGFTIGEHIEYALGRAVVDMRALLRAYDVRPPDPGHRADQLSGGNQQKMILAIASAEHARLLVMAYPTRGLDVRASLTVRKILAGLADERRVGIIVTSSDLDELLALCHRIVVMRRGKVVGTQSRGEFDVNRLAEWYTAEEASAAVEGAP